MILVVGERIHSPGMTPGRVECWRARWRERPVPCILETPAFEWGQSTDRLWEGLDPLEWRAVNLLPPSNKAGTWDRDLAEFCAEALKSWACGQRRLKMILLGPRVAEPMTGGLSMREIDGVRYLCLHHPKSTLWEAPTMRRAIKQFRNWYSDCERFDQS